MVDALKSEEEDAFTFGIIIEDCKALGTQSLLCSFYLSVSELRGPSYSEGSWSVSVRSEWEDVPPGLFRMFCWVI